MDVIPSISKDKIQVVYPPCDVDSSSCGMTHAISRRNRGPNQRYTFMSMNRFWPEKCLDIIVKAARILRDQKVDVLVQLAGSVMPHIPESRIYYAQLQQMVDDYNLRDVVQFVPSPSEAEKFKLYRECDSVLYTPPNEHFGIVPIEALEQRRPVIVIDSGGPSETVIEDKTGTKIAHPDGELLAKAMKKHIKKESWEELDDDDKYKYQVRTKNIILKTLFFYCNDCYHTEILHFQKDRFIREFSAQGFGNRIDEAVVKMYPNEYIPLAQKQQHQKSLSKLPFPKAVGIQNVRERRGNRA